MPCLGEYPVMEKCMAQLQPLVAKKWSHLCLSSNRDSVNIYCEWLSALLPNPKLCVPRCFCHFKSFLKEIKFHYRRFLVSQQFVMLPRPLLEHFPYIFHISPRPVLEQPNLYARKIITHFNHLFVPRKGEGEFHDILFAL